MRIHPLLILFIVSACSPLSYTDKLSTSVAGTLTAQTESVPQSTLVQPTLGFPPTSTPIPLVFQTITVSPSTQITTQPTLPIPEIITGTIGQQLNCAGVLSVSLPQPPELAKDLFEHHAKGTFLILELEIINNSSQMIQIWDGDYQLIGKINDHSYPLGIQNAVTGYLYITRGKNLWQDQIPGGQRWTTLLAFDINPDGKTWILKVHPGSEGGNPLCQLEFTITL